MPASIVPPHPLPGDPCDVCSHKPHEVRGFISGEDESLTYSGEVCFGCPECDRLFGLVASVLTPARIGHEPLLA